MSPEHIDHLRRLIHHPDVAQRIQASELLRTLSDAGADLPPPLKAAHKAWSVYRWVMARIGGGTSWPDFTLAELITACAWQDEVEVVPVRDRGRIGSLSLRKTPKLPAHLPIYFSVGDTSLDIATANITLKHVVTGSERANHSIALAGLPAASFLYIQHTITGRSVMVDGLWEKAEDRLQTQRRCSTATAHMDLPL